MTAKNFMTGLFARPPFKPMQEHMKIVESCAAEMLPLFEALAACDYEAVSEHKDKIFDLEQQADDVKNEIRSHLPKSLFLPVARRDLLDMLHAQDSIADTVQDVAGLLVLRKTEIPAEFRDLLPQYVKRNVDAVRQCRKVIDELDELVELGFGGRAVEHVEAMLSELGAIEGETDDQGMEMTKRLFAIDEQLSRAAFVVWYEMIDLLGDVADYAEDVGDRLRLLIAR